MPEVWRYRVGRRKLWFGRRDGKTYRKLAASNVLPGLKPEAVLGLVDGYLETQELVEWSRRLEDVWFPQHRQELIDGGAGH